MNGLSPIGVAMGLLLVFAASRVQKFYRGLQMVSNVHGMRMLFSPMSLLGAILPTAWWNPGLGFTWVWRETNFHSYRREIISSVPFLLGSPMFYIGSLGMSRQLLMNERKISLEKPKGLLVGLLLWGESVVSANEDIWKKHRRIMMSAFTPTMYSLVLDETISVYREMVSAEGWLDQKEVVVDNFNRLPVKVTFTVIARCAFGLEMPWSAGTDRTASVEEGLTPGEALRIVCETTLTRLAVPRWAYKLPIPSLHRLDMVWNYLAKFMNDAVAAKREELAASDLRPEQQTGDVFTRLVAASDEGASLGLEDADIVGNMFALMFAGHETTANVLSATLTFLGIYQDAQEQALNEIVSVIGNDRLPTLDDLRKLPFLLSCFYECIRLFPSGVLLVRRTTQDINLTMERPSESTIHINKGTDVIVDMIGVHHNPYDFPDPDEFKPSRWQGVHEQDVSVFGFGPRACLGRKFTQTEALTFLVMFLRDWKVDVLLALGETKGDYMKRVKKNAHHTGFSFSIGSVDLKFIRRSV